MDYKVGFFFNLPLSRKAKNIVIVVFDSGSLRFKLVDRSLFPYINYHLDRTYYSFEYPILYTEDIFGNVKSVIYLEDIPIRYDSEVTREGVELSVPFWGFHKTNNPCRKARFACGERLSYDIVTASILENGIEVISIPEITRCNKRIWQLENCMDMATKVFYKSVIIYYVLRHIVSSIENDAFTLGLFNINYRNQNVTDFFEKAIKIYKEYLDTLSVNDLIEDLSVEVTEQFRHKIGDDDGYYVHRKASVSSPLANHDLYLNRLIGLGDKRIYEAHGYCTAESMSIKGLVTGKYKDDDLAREKERIISEYSKEKHMGFLLAEIVSAIMQNLYELDGWRNLLRQYRSFLINSFHLDVLVENGKSYLRNFYSTNNDQCAMIEELNKKCSFETKCTLSQEELDIITNSGFKGKPFRVLADESGF